MLDLSKEERIVLNRVGEHGQVFRQADVFMLVAGSKMDHELDSDVCKSLINKGALKEIREDVGAWIYIAEAKLFSPNYIVEHDD